MHLRCHSNNGRFGWDCRESPEIRLHLRSPAKQAKRPRMHHLRKRRFPLVFRAFSRICENVFSSPLLIFPEFGRKKPKIHRESNHIFPFIFDVFVFPLFYRCENVFSRFTDHPVLPSAPAPSHRKRPANPSLRGGNGALHAPAVVENGEDATIVPSYPVQPYRITAPKHLRPAAITGDS